MYKSLSFIFKWRSREKALRQIESAREKTQGKFGGNKREISGYDVESCEGDDSQIRLKIYTYGDYKDEQLKDGLEEVFPNTKINRDKDGFKITFD